MELFLTMTYYEVTLRYASGIQYILVADYVEKNFSTLESSAD